MRKNTEKTDSLNRIVHQMWHEVDDEMDRLELKGFVTDDNQPRLRHINNTDEVGVEEVLVIGGYLALTKLHNEMHQIQSKTLETKLDDVLDGKADISEIIPDDMPPQIAKAMEQLIESVKKTRRGKK